MAQQIIYGFADSVFITKNPSTRKSIAELTNTHTHTHTNKIVYYQKMAVNRFRQLHLQTLPSILSPSTCSPAEATAQRVPPKPCCSPVRESPQFVYPRTLSSPSTEPTERKSPQNPLKGEEAAPLYVPDGLHLPFPSLMIFFS